MGKRSRKRGVAPARHAPAVPPRTPPRPRSPARGGKDERPPAPWAPVPVTEVAIAAGLVAMLVGFSRGSDGVVTMLIGLGVAGLAVIELTAREHFAGMRSHTLLLALAPTVVLEGALYGLGLTGPFLLAIALPVYAGLFFLMRDRFRRARDVRALSR
jgi:hypothetical protein